jgi:hypothetical protein
LGLLQICIRLLSVWRYRWVDGHAGSSKDAHVWGSLRIQLTYPQLQRWVQWLQFTAFSRLRLVFVPANYAWTSNM